MITSYLYKFLSKFIKLKEHVIFCGNEIIVGCIYFIKIIIIIIIIIIILLLLLLLKYKLNILCIEILDRLTPFVIRVSYYLAIEIDLLS